MPSTSLSMPGLSLGKRQRGTLRGQCCLQTQPLPPWQCQGSSVSCSMWGALGFNRRGKWEKRGEAPPKTRSSPTEGSRNFEQHWNWAVTSLLWDGEVAVRQSHKIPTFSSWMGWAQQPMVGAQSILSRVEWGKAWWGAGGAQKALTWWWRPGWCPHA